MNFSRRRFLGAVAAGSAGMVSPRVFASVRSGDRPDLLPRALAALDSHSAVVRHRDAIGLIDFAVHSGRPRFDIVEVANGRILSAHLVAHGRGSDPANTGWLQRFSNRPGSHASSRGSFLTGSDYYGKHDRSARLRGLDVENSNAASRAIVIHSADYVSRSLANSTGRVGRSQGCFTVPGRDIRDVLDRLGEGRLLFAWK